MDIERTIDIAATSERVWDVLVDVEHWPDWTLSVRSVKLLDGALESGARVRVRQPRLPVATWRVTALEPGRYFEWESVAFGVRTVAGHRVEAIADQTRVTLSILWYGPLARLVRRLYGGLTGRYVDMEARGLKYRCEKISLVGNLHGGRAAT